jgi:hypothetical protein
MHPSHPTLPPQETPTKAHDSYIHHNPVPYTLLTPDLGPPHPHPSSILFASRAIHQMRTHLAVEPYELMRVAFRPRREDNVPQLFPCLFLACITSTSQSQRHSLPALAGLESEAEVILGMRIVSAYFRTPKSRLLEFTRNSGRQKNSGISSLTSAVFCGV